jgi:hypothetical protein
MKRTHPKLQPAAALALLVIVTSIVGGCRNQQSVGMTNPFLAPNRVPPPATRALAPGTARPYYPGDPLPSMQGAAGTGATQVATAQSERDMQGPDRNDPVPRPSLAFSNEPSVTIPGDNDELRFPLPKPPEPEPIAAAPAADPHRTSPQRDQVAAVAPSFPVAPAAFFQPASNPTGAADNRIAPENGIANTGLWRSPQIPSPSAATTAQAWPPRAIGATILADAPLSAPIIAGTSPTAALPANFDVRLRAVPSPALPSVESGAPRIRLPSYTLPASATGSQIEHAAAIQQAAHFAPNRTGANTLSSGGQPQTSQVTPAPPSAFYPTPASDVATLHSRDGFRPRGSTR